MKSASYINSPKAAPRRLGAGSRQFAQWPIWLGFVLIFLSSSCATNLYLGPSDLLIKGEPTFSKSDTTHHVADTTLQMRIQHLKELGESTVDPDLLYSSVRTRPNRRMVVPKTYLHLYNLGRSLQRFEYPPERWLHLLSPNNRLVDTVAAFLVRTAGEPPKLIDTLQLERDVENLKNVYFSQGFFHAQVFSRIDTCHSRLNAQKANVTFLIHEGPAAIIDKIRQPMVPDEEVRRVLINNLPESFLRTGDTYNEDALSAEQSRIVNVMRNNGYFAFSPKMVFFDIDTLPPDTLGTLPNNSAIKEFRPIWVQVKIPDMQTPYKVGKISMIIEPAEFDPELDQVMKVVSPGMMSDSLRHAWHLSSTHYSDSSKITFITYERVLERTNLNFLEKLVTLQEGVPYTLGNERKTQMRLQNLGIFKFVLIKPSLNEETQTVDFQIQAVLLQRFQAKAGLEGFFQNDPILKSNLPGIGAELSFRDKFVFKGAERLDISAKGSMRFYRAQAGDTLNRFYEGNGSASLQFPRILAPGLARRNIQGFEPSTSFTATFGRQQSRDYVRNTTNLEWNYRWYHSSTNKKAQSSLSPYVIGFVQSQVLNDFGKQIRQIDNPTLLALIAQDFRPRFNSWGNYKFSYNNATTSKLRHSLSFVGNLQIGGNTPFLIDRFGGVDTTWKDHKLDYIFYGQYFKISSELKNFWPIGRHGALVMRNHAGMAQPWNYTTFVPLDSRFFAGGTNSMRGWQSNTLGPGTYSQVNNSGTGGGGEGGVVDTLAFLIAPGGELIFETNVELRYDVYKWIKMAIFSDVGNVWFLPRSDVNFEGGKLSKETILQLGWDIGVGVRLDFDFFLFRVDVAKQVYAPDLKGFVTKSNPSNLGGNRFQLNFGIGYPF